MRTSPRKTAWAILLMALTGCVSPLKVSTNQTHTLAGSDRMPRDEISQLFTKAQWSKLGQLEYASYVITTAQVTSDDKVHVGKIVESWPDHSRDLLASTFGNKMVVRARTTGTHIPAQAEVYVIFYDKMLEGNLAVTFARQTDSSLPGDRNAARSLDTAIY